MVRIITCLLFAMAPALASGESLESGLFILDLPGGWEIAGGDDHPAWSDDPYHLVFEDGRAGATISTMTFDHPDREALANEYLDIRLEAEREVNAELGITVTYEEAFEDKGYGHQIEYFGSDSSGRLFRYWGFIRDTKLINIYLESYELPAESLEEEFRRLLAGLRF